MKNNVSAFHWIRNAYFKAALIPLLLAEASLLLAFIFTNQFTLKENISTISSLAEFELLRRVEHESALINQQLSTVKSNTLLLQQQTLRAHNTDFFSQQESDNNIFDPTSTAYYSKSNIDKTALFYTGKMTIGSDEKLKANQLSQLSPFMVDLNLYNELVIQVYYCTYDSMVRITPYLNVLSTFPLKMDLPSYKFYFTANAKNNPSRKAVWTGVYQDMAGLGWMVSSLAPVYRGDFLEGVVAQDVTVDALIKQVQNVQLPWNGYGMLLDEKGRIMAIPHAHKNQWQLNDLKHSDSARKGDALSHTQFQIHQRRDTQKLSSKMQQHSSGIDYIELPDKQLVAWSTIPETQWSLLFIVDKQSLLAPAKQLSERSDTTFYIIVSVLFVFYFIFFEFLYLKSKRMSRQLADALMNIRKITKSIVTGEQPTKTPDSGITEVNDAIADLESLGYYINAQDKKSNADDAL